MARRTSRQSARSSRQAKFLGTGKFKRDETAEQRRFRLTRERQTTQPIRTRRVKRKK